MPRELCETSRNWTLRRATKTAKCCARFDITGPGVQLPEVEDAVERFEEAFHIFVSSHENDLRYEVDEEMRALMIIET